MNEFSKIWNVLIVPRMINSSSHRFVVLLFICSDWHQYDISIIPDLPSSLTLRIPPLAPVGLIERRTKTKEVESPAISYLYPHSWPSRVSDDWLETESPPPPLSTGVHCPGAAAVQINIVFDIIMWSPRSPAHLTHKIGICGVNGGGILMKMFHA